MPSSVLGTILALLLCIVVVACAWLVVRKPPLGIGILVAGMAFHNFVIMVLLRLATPDVLIRAVQGWKELLLALLTIMAVARVAREIRGGKRLHLLPIDWVAIAFFTLLLIYVAIPSSLLSGHSGFLRRLVAFRVDALIPLLYFLGRVFATTNEEDLSSINWLIVGAGALVGAFGLYELWLVPTARWLDWGVNLYSSWLGFVYNGPAGLPENFFQTLPDGYLLRRMVSTYISPLGIAYTGILVWPLATVMIAARPADKLKAILSTTAVALLLVGILLSVTRLAIFMVMFEAILIALLIRTRLGWALAVVVGVAATVVLFVYPYFGPVVDPYLLPGVSRSNYLFAAGDPSFQEHLRQLQIDLKAAAQHPFGVGLGETIGRFVKVKAGTPGPGESAVLGVFIDVGVVGGSLYLLLYGLGAYAGWLALRKHAGRWLQTGLPLVALAGGLALFPVTMTSDLWGDFSVTFLFWLAVGFSVTAARGPLLVPPSTSRAGMAPARRADLVG